MPSTWFIVKSDRELGPYTSAQLKQFAQSGQLKADDFVRRDDRLAPVVAREIQGLFQDAQTHDYPKTTAPPLPSDRAKASGEASTAQPPLLSTKTVGSVFRRTVTDLTETTKAAGQMAVADSVGDVAVPTQRQPWYCHWAFLAATTLICFPATLVLVWWKSTYSKRAKWAWTGACGVMLLAMANAPKQPAERLQRPERVGQKEAAPNHKATGEGAKVTSSSDKTSKHVTESQNTIREEVSSGVDETLSAEDVIPVMALAATGVTLGTEDSDRVSNQPWLRIGPEKFNDLMRQAASVLGCEKHSGLRHLLNITPSETKERDGQTVLYYDKQKYNRTFVTFAPNRINGKTTFVGSVIDGKGYTPIGIFKDNKVITQFGELSVEEFRRLFKDK